MKLFPKLLPAALVILALARSTFSAPPHPALPSAVIPDGLGVNIHFTDPRPGEMEEIAAVACAVENLWLSLAVYGLGGYWSTGGTTYDPAAGDFLGLEGEDRLMGFFYLGYTRIPSAKGTRRPVGEKTTWVKE